MKEPTGEYSSLCLELRGYHGNRRAQIRLWHIIHPILVATALKEDWDELAKIWAENKALIEEAVE